MRGFNPNVGVSQQPQGSQGGFLSPQTLGLLMQAYKANAGSGDMDQTGNIGTTGTEYAAGPGQLPNQQAGYGMGQPLVAGGATGQPQTQGQNQLLEAMMRQNQRY